MRRALRAACAGPGLPVCRGKPWRGVQAGGLCANACAYMQSRPAGALAAFAMSTSAPFLCRSRRRFLGIAGQASRTDCAACRVPRAAFCTFLIMMPSGVSCVDCQTHPKELWWGVLASPGLPVAPCHRCDRPLLVLFLRVDLLCYRIRCPCGRRLPCCSLPPCIRTHTPTWVCAPGLPGVNALFAHAPQRQHSTPVPLDCSTFFLSIIPQLTWITGTGILWSMHHL